MLTRRTALQVHDFTFCVFTRIQDKDRLECDLPAAKNSPLLPVINTRFRKKVLRNRLLICPDGLLSDAEAASDHHNLYSNSKPFVCIGLWQKNKLTRSPEVTPHVCVLLTSKLSDVSSLAGSAVTVVSVTQRHLIQSYRSKQEKPLIRTLPSGPRFDTFPNTNPRRPPLFQQVQYQYNVAGLSNFRHSHSAFAKPKKPCVYPENHRMNKAVVVFTKDETGGEHLRQHQSTTTKPVPALHKQSKLPTPQRRMWSSHVPCGAATWPLYTARSAWSRSICECRFSTLLSIDDRTSRGASFAWLSVLKRSISHWLLSTSENSLRFAFWLACFTSHHHSLPVSLVQILSNFKHRKKSKVKMSNIYIQEPPTSGKVNRPEKLYCGNSSFHFKYFLVKFMHQGEHDHPCFPAIIQLAPGSPKQKPKGKQKELRKISPIKVIDDQNSARSAFSHTVHENNDSSCGEQCVLHTERSP